MDKRNVDKFGYFKGPQSHKGFPLPHRALPKTTKAKREEQILKSPWSGKDNTENEKRGRERGRTVQRKQGPKKGFQLLHKQPDFWMVDFSGNLPAIFWYPGAPCRVLTGAPAGS